MVITINILSKSVGLYNILGFILNHTYFKMLILPISMLFLPTVLLKAVRCYKICLQQRFRNEGYTMEKTKDKKVCFVVTPIGDNNTDIRRHIDGIIDQAIEPALGEKYEIVVAHRKYEIGSINDRVIKSVFESDLVIANLTNTNPNVMFELAIRYSFGKPAIVIAEKGTKLPFDVIDENTIFYVNDPAGANDLKQSIIEYEKNIDSGKSEYGPVFKVINKIPLYNEVEAGKDVSGDKLSQYIIDRLDSLEKMISSIALGTLNKARNDNCILEYIFRNEEGFNSDNEKEIKDILSKYAISNDQYISRSKKNISCGIKIKRNDIKDIESDILNWMNRGENRGNYEIIKREIT